MIPASLTYLWSIKTFSYNEPSLLLPTYSKRDLKSVILPHKANCLMDLIDYMNRSSSPLLVSQSLNFHLHLHCLDVHHVAAGCWYHLHTCFISHCQLYRDHSLERSTYHVYHLEQVEYDYCLAYSICQLTWIKVLELMVTIVLMATPSVSLKCCLLKVFLLQTLLFLLSFSTCSYTFSQHSRSL